MTRLNTNLTVLAAIIAALKLPNTAVALSILWLLYLLLDPAVLWIRNKLSKQGQTVLEHV